MLNGVRTPNDFSGVLYFVSVEWDVSVSQKGSNVDVIFMLPYVYRDTNKFPSNTVFMYSKVN